MICTKFEEFLEKVKFIKQPKKKDAKTDVYNVDDDGVIGQIKWSSRMRGYSFQPTSENDSEIKEFIKDLNSKRRIKAKKSKKVNESIINNDIEDILLPFIDDKLCTMEENEHFKEFKFSNQEDLNNAKERLKKFNVKNYFTDGLSVFWYSKEVEDFFLKFLNDDYEKVKGKRFDIVWKKDGIGYFGQDLKNKNFYINYDPIWSVFGSKYSMKYRQIQAFTQNMLNEHTELKDYTTISRKYFRAFS